MQDFIREVAGRMREDRLPLAAAAISFYLLVSLVPMLLLVLSIAAFFIDPEVARHRLEELQAVLGSGIAEVLQHNILTVVEHRGILTGLALLIGFWTGSQVFVTLETAINQVWRSRRRRPFWLSRLLALLMVIISSVVLFLAVALMYLINLLRQLDLPGLHREVNFLVTVLISLVLPALLTTIIFAVIFHVLPTKRVTWRSVLPGALFSGVVWTIFLRLFGLYVENFNRYPVLYGSLGGLVLLMFLFYYSALIMLAGAEIAAVYHWRRMEEGDTEEQQAEET